MEDLKVALMPRSAVTMVTHPSVVLQLKQTNKTNIHEKCSPENNWDPALTQVRSGREEMRAWSLAVCISGSRGPVSPALCWKRC